MPVQTSFLRRILAPLSELNPLWVAAVGALLLALAAVHSMRSHVRDSERLQDRLTGSALIDALKLYAEATPPGQSAHPPSLADLGDDNRDGHHHNWLDGASAEALADAAHWELLRDAGGQLRGARVRADETEGMHWLPSWLSGPAGPARADSYVVDVAVPGPAPAPAPVPAPQAAQVLPQPVMPDTPLPQPVAAKSEAKEAALPPALAGASDPRVVNAQVLDPASKASGKPAAPGTGPSRILAGLQARQVLRLSASDTDEPVLTPRRLAPPPPAPARPAAVGVLASGAAPAPTGSQVAASGGVPQTALPQPTLPQPAASKSKPVVAQGAVSKPSAPVAASRRLPVASLAAHPAKIAPSPVASGKLTRASPPAAATPAAPAVAAPAVPASATPAVPAAAAPAAPGVAPGNQAASAPGAQGANGDAAPAPSAASGVLRRISRLRPGSSPLPGTPDAGQPASTSGSANGANGMTGSGVPGSTPAMTPGVGSAPGAASGAPAAMPPATAITMPAGAAPSGAAMPAGAAPGGRMDTVIYEDNQGAPAEPPKVDCRTLAGDAGECDVFEDTDPQLYQRCYQSLSERINACLAGEQVPPLITH